MTQYLFDTQHVEYECYVTNSFGNIWIWVRSSVWQDLGWVYYDYIDGDAPSKHC